MPSEQYQELTEKLTALKPLITQLPPSQHFGINNKQVPDLARNAYDIHQAIQHYWQQKSPLAGSPTAPLSQYGTNQLPLVKSESA